MEIIDLQSKLVPTEALREIAQGLSGQYVILNTAPQVWPLGKNGYAFDEGQMKADPMKVTLSKDIPVMTMDKIS